MSEGRPTIKTLANWLQAQLDARGLTQTAVSVHAGVSVGTISQILNQDHIPRIETLFRLADFFETPRERIPRLAARMPLGEDPPPELDDDYIVEALLEEFRKVPDEWKEAVVQQVRFFRRLSENPPIRFVGEEEPDQ